MATTSCITEVAFGTSSLPVVGACFTSYSSSGSSTSSATPSASLAAQEQGPSGNGLSTGAGIGIGIGIFFLIAAGLCVAVVAKLRRDAREKAHESRQKPGFNAVPLIAGGAQNGGGGVRSQVDEVHEMSATSPGPDELDANALHEMTGHAEPGELEGKPHSHELSIDDSSPSVYEMG